MKMVVWVELIELHCSQTNKRVPTNTQVPLQHLHNTTFTTAAEGINNNNNTQHKQNMIEYNTYNEIEDEDENSSKTNTNL